MRHISTTTNAKRSRNGRRLQKVKSIFLHYATIIVLKIYGLQQYENWSMITASKCEKSFNIGHKKKLQQLLKAAWNIFHCINFFWGQSHPSFLHSLLEVDRSQLKNIPFTFFQINWSTQSIHQMACDNENPFFSPFQL